MLLIEPFLEVSKRTNPEPDIPSEMIPEVLKYHIQPLISIDSLGVL